MSLCPRKVYEQIHIINYQGSWEESGIFYRKDNYMNVSLDLYKHLSGQLSHLYNGLVNAPSQGLNE